MWHQSIKVWAFAEAFSDWGWGLDVVAMRERRTSFGVVSGTTAALAASGSARRGRLGRLRGRAEHNNALPECELDSRRSQPGIRSRPVLAAVAFRLRRGLTAGGHGDPAMRARVRARAARDRTPHIGARPQPNPKTTATRSGRLSVVIPRNKDKHHRSGRMNQLRFDASI